MSDQLEFRHLRYIVAVAETLNFTRAAERLFLAQPSLSKQIRDLEDQIGFMIFRRNRDGVSITPAGHMVVAYAQEALSARGEIVRVANDVHLGNIAPLRLGFSSFINRTHLQWFRSMYHELFPKCEVNPLGGDSKHLLDRLDRGDLDCALLQMPVPGRQWSCIQVARIPLVVCMRIDDPLAREPQVSLEAVAARLTVFRDPEGHPAAHSRLLQMFAEAGHPVHISCSASSPHDIQLLVRDGYGIALISEDSLLESDLTTRRIAGVEWTADTAFVHHVHGDHAALPFVDRLLSKKPPKSTSSIRPQLQLKFGTHE